MAFDLLNFSLLAAGAAERIQQVFFRCAFCHAETPGTVLVDLFLEDNDLGDPLCAVLSRFNRRVCWITT